MSPWSLLRGVLECVRSHTVYLHVIMDKAWNISNASTDCSAMTSHRSPASAAFTNRGVPSSPGLMWWIEQKFAATNLAWVYVRCVYSMICFINTHESD